MGFSSYDFDHDTSSSMLVGDVFSEVGEYSTDIINESDELEALDLSDVVDR